MEVHHCIHCGTESQPSWRFCRRCGTALENLAEQPHVAACSNCSSPVADGWRFCANCGTNTDTATAAAAGLSEDDVAELIAPPAPSSVHHEDTADSEDTAPYEDTAPHESASEPTSVVESSVAGEALDVSDPTSIAEADVAGDAIAPAMDVPEVASADFAVTPGADLTGPATAENGRAAEAQHTISEPSISFEPSVEPGAGPTPAEEFSAPPAPLTGVPTAPPPPPPDPLLRSDQEIVAAKSSAEAPPSPPMLSDPVAAEEVIDVAEVPTVQVPQAKPHTDPFAAVDAAARSAIGEEAAAVLEGQPAVVIPPLEEDRDSMRTEVPQPIGAPVSQEDRSIPRPIGADAEPSGGSQQSDEGSQQSDEVAVETPADRARRPRVAVPEPIAERDRQEERRDLPPISTGHFRNPGIVGQGVQIALLVTALIAVAMIVALTVLNNRLDAYGTTGEGLSRVNSAESMVNSWMRPLIIGSVLITYALVAAWGRRIVANLAAFGKDVEETALWMWMVPGANMWVLLRHYHLGWKGADVYALGGRDWMRGRPDWWTVAFVTLPVLGFLFIIYAAFIGADTFESAINANAFSLIGYALLAFGLLSGVRAISNVIDRQRSRSEALGA